MWIVRLALRRPYTFVVAPLILLLLAPLVIWRTPKDIFPPIDIPVVSAVWTYGGLSAQEIEQRILYSHERMITAMVDDIEHIESTGAALPNPYGGKVRVVSVDLDPAALQARSIIQEQIDGERAALRSSQRQLQLAENRYRGGLASYLQVTAAQTVALEHERTVARLHGQRLIACVNLVRALGGGWDRSAAWATNAGAD